jgi:hypothetical protein
VWLAADAQLYHSRPFGEVEELISVLYGLPPVCKLIGHGAVGLTADLYSACRCVGFFDAGPDGNPRTGS